MSDDHRDPQTITGLCSMATRHILAELATTYERQSGTRLALTAVGGVDAVGRVESGEVFDFVVLTGEALERLAQSGFVAREDCRDLAWSRIAVAVRVGTPPPDISVERAVRDAVLAAKRVGYSSGPSGTHLLQLLQRWGIADAVTPRLVKAPPGTPVATLLASGTVELGFQQRSELLGMPGIAIVGDMPPAIQATTVFSGAPLKSAPHREAARHFLDFAASKDAHDAVRRHGMSAAGSNGRWH